MPKKPNDFNLTELDILTIFYFYAKSFHSYVLRLDSEFFSDEMQPFFEILQAHYKAYGTVPSDKVFETELEGDEQKSAVKIWKKVYENYERVKHLTHDYIVEKLDHFAKGCFLKRFLLNSYDLYETGKYEKIIQNVSRLNESIIDNDLGKEFHDDEFIDDRYDPQNYGSMLRTGFNQFDETFGGWYRKALHIIAGPSNAGKTLWLINIVANLLLNQEQTGLKILYVTLEIDEAQVGRRLDASLLETPMSEVAQYRDLRLREKIAESKETRGNRLIIKEMPGYKTTPSDIEALMRNLEITSEGMLKPDVVIIDYIGLMMPTRMTKDTGLYEKGLGIAVELRSLAQRYNIPFIVAAQTNRSSFEDRVGQDKIADSIGIAQTCDLLMTINRNKELDEKDQVTLYLAKSRFSKSNETFLFQVKYDCMRVDDIMGGVSPDGSEDNDK